MKKGKVFVFYFLVFMTLSCNKEEKEIEYYWVTKAGSKNQIEILTQQEKGDTTILSYFAELDTLHYFIINKNKNNSFTVSSYINGIIQPFMDTTIKFNGNLYKVEKFIQKEAGIDGGIIHYYNSQHGIFAIHSITWPGLQFLQSTDTIKNRQVKALIKATVPEFFKRKKL